MSLNMTAIPQAFAEIFGISYDASGILISVVLTICILLAFALLMEGFNIMPIAIVGIGCFSLFTFLGWFPIWIMIIICLIIAVLVASQATKTISGAS